MAVVQGGGEDVLEAVAQPIRLVGEGALVGGTPDREPEGSFRPRAGSGGRRALLWDQPEVGREPAEEISGGSRCIGDSGE